MLLYLKRTPLSRAALKIAYRKLSPYINKQVFDEYKLKIRQIRLRLQFPNDIEKFYFKVTDYCK